MTQTLGERTARAHDSFRHEAYLYRGEQDFLASTAAFVREGVAAGQPVMVAVVPQRLERLREDLGTDADDVWFVDMAALGHNPAGIIPAWQGFVEAFSDGGQPVRGVGEPVWAGRREAEIAECQLHEALLNMAVAADTPLWLRCPYDVAALDDSVLHEMRRSHPVLVDAGEYRGSTSYGGSDLVESMFGEPLGSPGPGCVSVDFGATDLSLVRAIVRDTVERAGLGPDVVDDVELAVHELSTNSVRHGGGRGTLLTWQEPEALVLEVRDTGVITDRLAGRRQPATGAPGSRGLWLANQLCDLVQLRSDAGGTTVRVMTWTG
jgi:anti-sigma regulatory factor (Ser/Thr protein kinase)